MNGKLQARVAKLERKLARQPSAGPALRDLFGDVEALVDALLKSMESGQPPVRPACIPEAEWNDYLQAIGQRLGKPEAVDWGSFLLALGCTEVAPASFN